MPDTLSQQLQRRDIAGVPAEEIAEEFGTPTYVYDAATIVERLMSDAGFRFAKTHEASGPVRVEDYAHFVRGLVAGNPTILEIEKRASAGVEEVIEACVQAAVDRIGPPPRDFELPAIFCLCRKPE